MSASGRGAGLVCLCHADAPRRLTGRLGQLTPPSALCGGARTRSPSAVPGRGTPRPFPSWGAALQPILHRARGRARHRRPFRSELDTLFATMDSHAPVHGLDDPGGFGQALACPLLGWLFWRVWRTRSRWCPLEEPVASVPEGLPRRAGPDRVSTPSPPPRQNRPGWTSLALRPSRSSLLRPIPTDASGPARSCCGIPSAGRGGDRRVALPPRCRAPE